MTLRSTTNYEFQSLGVDGSCCRARCASRRPPEGALQSEFLNISP